MQLTDRISAFITCPFPLWEHGLTDLLAAQKLQAMVCSGHLPSQDDYSTASAFLGTPFPSAELTMLAEGRTYLEPPSDALRPFYAEHGLEVVSVPAGSDPSTASRLTAALRVLGYVPECLACVTTLAKRVQVLRQEHPDYDTSYSHPAIPFSIFVSVCGDDGPVSSLRVAENILHESMHLKLTLIEEITPLVRKGADDLFFSPWRDEERPLRGVLHGMFVFRAIHQFYSCVLPMVKGNDTGDAVAYRLEQIEKEIAMLSDFYRCPGLTTAGSMLSARLISPATP